MSAKTISVPGARLYEEDFLAWIEEMTRLLRARRFEELDLENLIEEVDSMGISQRHERDNRLVVILEHLLKWKYQPGRRSKSWRSTLVTQRASIERLFGSSPSLKRGLTGSLAGVYRHAVRVARVETDLPAKTFPDRCPFTPEQILDPDYLPE